MRLVSARVVGFQSFTDSGTVEFSNGINLIVGQNNAGKSALLRALLPNLADDRHRTPERWEDIRLPPPIVRMSIELSGQELETMALRAGNSYLPTPYTGDAADFARLFFAQESLVLVVSHGPARHFEAPYPSHRQFSWSPGAERMCALTSQHNGELTFQPQYKPDDSTAQLLFDLWNTTMFYFSAERMTIGESSHAYARRLTSNADNLPAVLLTLNGDRGDIFDRLVGHLREIFPTVGNLSVRPKPGDNRIEVRVWPTEAMERVELSFPLNSSGTGISQVIALLTAIMTVENTVVIIDEINSFLHPAAVKALLRILQTEYSQHQYIISTHAPEVIGFSNPRTIHLVRRSGYESTVQMLKLDQVDEFRKVAEHLGVSMADVFAAERVIWVEGPTEELCFPLLYRQAAGRSLPRGTIFTSVVATGDFVTKKRDRKLIYEVYQRLSGTTMPLVVNVGFSFDSETLSDTDKKNMAKESGGRIHFLPRRHLECYLIEPTAIAAFIAERDNASASVVTVETVAVRLADLAADSAFKIEEWRGDIADDAWQTKANAAKLIARVCSDLSEQRVTFNKKDDTLTLLRYVQDTNPKVLASLATYVQNLVQFVAPETDVTGAK